MTARVLVVDDDPATCRMIELGLRSEGYDVSSSPNARDALESARSFEPHVVLTDLNMGETSGLQLCAALSEQWPDIPVVVITAFGSMETAILAMRAGAYDFITKPFDIEALALAIARAVQHHQLRSEVKRLRAAVGQAGWGDDLIGSSVPMLELRALLERIAQTDTTVLVTGETGTGKEVVARVLHQHGKRRNGPFVAVNCSALPEALLESTLFGHVRGAFTDARQARQGLFLEAHGGTLFLDEIGEMPAGLQPKLLRALEARCVRAVGADNETPFDARIIAATNRDLDDAVQEGRFREDLYYRLNVLHVALPPLRSRGGDVIALAQHFLVQFASQSERPVLGISEAAARRLAAYPWPGNVRELRNSIERAVALTRFDHIAADDLPDRIKNFEPRHVLVAGDDLEEMAPLEEVERRYILRVLQAAGGNKSLAAQRLGVSRRTLYRKLGEYGVE
ncbi:MAG TPA: sigma-54 dependent transcriptional regulator [Polyangiaceae bacterium]|jgi:two-component system response regulator HydG|nr:sigma-54 dependent transcriptional regulator [Polyangiaceae bacterium]